MIDALRRWFGDSSKDALLEKIDELDNGQREARHNVRNLQSHAEYLRKLIGTDMTAGTMLELLDRLETRKANGKHHP